MVSRQLLVKPTDSLRLRLHLSIPGRTLPVGRCSLHAIVGPENEEGNGRGAGERQADTVDVHKALDAIIGVSEAPETIRNRRRSLLGANLGSAEQK